MKYFLSIALLFCLVSCGGGVSIDYPVFDLKDDVSSLELFNHVSDAEVIPLETSDDCLIRSIDKISKFGEGFLILDRKAGRILHFNHDGSYVGKIDRVGRGPGEYMFISDFDVVDDQIHVLDMDRVLVYDIDGNPLKTVMIDLDCDMCAFKAMEQVGYLVAAPDESCYLLHVIDAEGKEVSRMLKCSEAQIEALMMRTDGWCISSSGEETYLSVPFLESVFLLKDGEVQEQKLFVTSESPSGLIKKLAGKRDSQAFIDRISSECFNPGRKMATPFYYSCFGSFNGSPVLLFHEKATGNRSVYNVKKSIVALLLFGETSFRFTDDSYVADMSLLSREMVEKMLSFSRKNEKEYSILEQLVSCDPDSDNPILVQYHLQ